MNQTTGMWRRREVMDAYLRDRAEKLGAKVLNGLMMKMEQPGQ